MAAAAPFAACGANPPPTQLCIENVTVGLADRLAPFQADACADLLLLRKHPLEDPSAYDAFEKVMLNGRVLQRAALSARR
jgi:hypothetical protein